ncbi:siderophore-interacting protein [Nocardioides currus]|uniref:Siderophore-interacting protein n=1 Tax=Nocardioides currus TaxID=2133958 RepID=A0A2R7Z2I7_9ACTN|nr:siderophore-interacting protein [Nocardioides currus]PUA82820.1 siderophore-interacting protein [Nocardioides currus]
MPTDLTVTRTESITPTLTRVWFSSDDLSAFTDSVFTDRYVKLQFPDAGAVRTYTALFPDLEARTLAIDFVVHGDEGVAGPWASRAQPGDTLSVNGPGGAYRPDAGADWHLLVGDEAAVPAIAAALADLPADAVGSAIVLVDGPADEPSLEAPAGVEVRFLHRDGSPAQLVSAVRALSWPEGRVHAFVHGEAEEVMKGVRPHLLKERGLDRDQVSISGYWRRGNTEEGFRVWKSENRDA